MQQILEKFNFLPNDEPIDIRPSTCVTERRHASACQISPPYVEPFRGR